MRDLFAADPGRFCRFSLRLDDILFDYSKNRITDTTLALLCGLARQAGVETKRDAMFGQGSQGRIGGTGKTGAGQDALGDGDGLVAQTFQVDDRPGIADDTAQIQGDRLFQGQQSEAGLVDVAGLVVHRSFAVRHRPGRFSVLIEIGGCRVLAGLPHQGGQMRDAPLEGVQFRVEVRSRFHAFIGQRL